jgi:hypothetical protein
VSTGAPAIRLDRRELAGAVADVGVLVPIATALIVANGLAPTAVLLPAGLLYLAAGFLYRLPVPVQPLKAFGAVAIAEGLGSGEIAAGALLMGGVFVLLGRTGAVDLAARAFPKPLIRGVQLTVGLLFLKIAWGLVHAPPASFEDHAADPALLLGLGLLVAGAAFALRRHLVSLLLVCAGLGLALARAGGELSLGPSPLPLPALDAGTFWIAFVLLVVPQIPLTFANSCVATADTARTYFGTGAARVRPGRLATSLGIANLFSGAVAGMPVCHGAGGMTAHRAFGARTGGAPLAMGAALVALALIVGSGMTALLAAFPLAVLAGMLAVAGLLHIGLLRDLTGAWGWAIALLVGIAGILTNLAVGLALGLTLWWGRALSRRVRTPRAARRGGPAPSSAAPHR